MLCIILLLLMRIRIALPFLTMHTFFALGILGGVLWHALLLPSLSLTTKVTIFTAICLYMLSAAVRLGRVVFFSTSSHITDVYFDGSGKVVKFTASTERPLRIPSGSYFYAFIAGSYRIDFRSYALMAMPSRPDPSVIGQGVQDVTFVLATQTLPRTIRKLTVGQKLWLDGPYGPALQPEARENVVLVAEGIGILGVLPVALSIATRKLHDLQNGEASLRLDMAKEELLAAEIALSEKQNHVPADQASVTSLREKIAVFKQRLESDKKTERKPVFRDLTRRITILWILNENSQVHWVEEQINTLQKLDPNNVGYLSTARIQ